MILRNGPRVVAGSLIGLTVSAPTFLYGFSVYLKPMAAEMGWGRGDIILGEAVTSLTAAALAPLVGLLIDRLGGKRVALFGCLGLPVAIALVGMQHSYAMFLAVTLFGGVCCAFSAPPAYLSIVPQWFDRNLGAAIAVAATGLGLCSIVTPAATQAFISHVGWRRAALFVAMLVAAIGILNNLLLIRERPAFVAARKVARGGAAGEVLEGVAFSDGVRSPDFWKLSIAFTLVIAIASACFLNLSALASDRGFSPAQGAAALSLYGATSIVARLATGAMLDRMPPAVPALLFFGGAGLGVILLWAGWPAFYLPAAAALVGAAAGAESDLIPFIIRRRFGMRAYGRLYGVMFGVFQIGPVIGPLAMSIVYDRTGSYAMAFPALLAAAVAALALVGTSSFVFQRRGTISRP